MTSPRNRESDDGKDFLQGLSRYHQRRVVRFHTPGHRGGRWVDREILTVASPAPFALDVSDVLEGEDGPGDWSATLQASEQAASELFGTERTRFLVNGTTGGIHAVLVALAFNSKVAFGRASHLSVYAGAALSGAQPVYIPFRYDSDWDIPGPLPVEQIARLVASQEAALFVDTYPNYYGLAHPIGRLAEQLSVPLAVDEAHGSHFRFCPGAPPPALSQGALVSIQSAHKTLQALTQASFLHVRRGRGDVAARIDRALTLLQTTSPSPLLLASLEAVVAHTRESGEEPWARAVALAEAIRRAVADRTGLRCLDEREALRRWGARLDPTRVVINVAPAGVTGLRAAALLRRDHGIQVEMANQCCIVALVSPGNTEADGERLVKALVQLVKASKREGAPFSTPIPPPPIPPRALSLRDALGAPLEWIPIDKCVGRVCGELVCPYPPGIPVIVPGEEITSEIVEYLRCVRDRGWEVRGARFADLAQLGVIAPS